MVVQTVMRGNSSFNPLRKAAKTISLFIIGALSLLVAQGAFAWWGNDGVDVTVIDPFAEMRTGPGRGYPVFHVVEKGESVRLFKRRTDWYKVETTSGKTGWVNRASLNATLGPDGDVIDFAVPGWQDFVNRRWEFGFLGGDFEGARSLTTYLGYHLTHNIAGELKYTQAFGSFSDSKLASINVVHQPFPEWRLSPFFTLGTGILEISPSSDLVLVEDREDSVMTVGGGFLFYLSRSFLLRMEYNNHTVLTTRENNEEVEEWKAGFSVFF